MHVDLSVPQLALFIRLFIDTGIIKNDNNTALLKYFAAFVSTSKASVISAESLRVNFYSVPAAAKEIVKDRLIQMVNQLRNY